MEDPTVSRVSDDGRVRSSGEGGERVKQRRELGPVQALCEEIGFKFDRRLERQDVFVAFVRELVGEVADLCEFSQRIAHVTKKPPSEGSGEALRLSAQMLGAISTEDLIARAAEVHDACRRLNPDGAYPTDHSIDMLSSCASAIRFGLEMPCRSRHAAAAAQHVWKHKYGVSLFDDCTSAWENDWARQQLWAAIYSLLPVPPRDPPDASDEYREGE